MGQPMAVRWNMREKIKNASVKTRKKTLGNQVPSADFMRSMGRQWNKLLFFPLLLFHSILQ